MFKFFIYFFSKKIHIYIYGISTSIKVNIPDFFGNVYP